MGAIAQRLHTPLPSGGFYRVLDVIDVAARECDNAVSRLHILISISKAALLHLHSHAHSQQHARAGRMTCMISSWHHH